MLPNLGGKLYWLVTEQKKFEPVPQSRNGVPARQTCRYGEKTEKNRYGLPLNFAEDLKI